MRDNSRFHYFKDGRCSCSDYVEKKKKKKERTWNSGRCAEGKDEKMRKGDKDLGQKSSVE